jgi:hypothetical protein
MSGGWGCPHDYQGKCRRVKGRPCDPGMKGCILAGRFTFSIDSKNRPNRSRTGESQGRRGDDRPASPTPAKG